MGTPTFLVSEKSNKVLWEKLKALWLAERKPGLVIFEHNSYTVRSAGEDSLTFTTHDDVGAKTEMKTVDASPKPDFNTRPKK
jgi:hypothetical protein